DLRDVLHGDAAIDHVVGVDDEVRTDVAEVDRAAVVDENLGVEAAADDVETQPTRDVVGALLRAMGGGADEHVFLGPIHADVSSPAARDWWAQHRAVYPWRYWMPNPPRG